MVLWQQSLENAAYQNSLRLPLYIDIFFQMDELKEYLWHPTNPHSWSHCSLPAFLCDLSFLLFGHSDSYLWHPDNNEKSHCLLPSVRSGACGALKKKTPPRRPGCGINFFRPTPCPIRNLVYLFLVSPVNSPLRDPVFSNRFAQHRLISGIF